jgi:peroxiredoxin
MLRRVLAVVALSGWTTLAATVPRPSPEFAINTTTGKQILLSRYRGKVVALAFILTYCPHCQRTIAILSQMQKEYGPRGFQVLASATEEGAATAVPGFIQRLHPPFPVGYNDRGQVVEYLQRSPGVAMMMPQLVFIDRTGVIRAQLSGEEPFFAEPNQEKNIRAEIATLLKTSARHVTSRKKR